jgi:hypothetical protein
VQRGLPRWRVSHHAGDPVNYNLSQHLGAVEIVRSIVEADAAGLPRPTYRAHTWLSAFEAAGEFFDLPPHEVYAFIRDTMTKEQ